MARALCVSLPFPRPRTNCAGRADAERAGDGGGRPGDHRAGGAGGWRGVPVQEGTAHQTQAGQRPL